MGRVMVLVILSWIVFASGQIQGKTVNIQKAEYLGSWVGDPRGFLERQGFTIFLAQADYIFCFYGGPDGENENFQERIGDCLIKLTNKNEVASLFCGKRGFTYYGIANLRISHSSVIISAGNKYGHLMIVYGDIFCAIQRKK